MSKMSQLHEDINQRGVYRGYPENIGYDVPEEIHIVIKQWIEEDKSEPLVAFTEFSKAFIKASDLTQKDERYNYFVETVQLNP